MKAKFSGSKQLATAAALLLVIGVAGCATPNPNPSGSSSTSQSPSATATETPSPTPTPTPTPSFTPGNDVIYIDSPVPTQVITTTSYQVKGRASVFEGQFQFKLYRNGTLFESGPIQADGGSPELAVWSLDIDDLTTGNYRLVAYDTSEKDGSQILKTSVVFSVDLG